MMKSATSEPRFLESDCDAATQFLGMIALVINFNTAILTKRCLESLVSAGIPRVLILDNASCKEDILQLRMDVHEFGEKVQLIESPINLGFAAGSNLLIDLALKFSEMRFVLLLNSDAVVVSAGLAKMYGTAILNHCDLVGARIMSFPVDGDKSTSHVDSMGIAIYRPLLASNRKQIDERFLGPTGGCAIYSIELLNDLKASHGYVFDEDYFCYAEDTDVCIRSRLLGYSAEYVDMTAALHDGQASSGGGFSDFVLYHGIRNSIWTMVKSIPLRSILLNLPFIVALHLGIIIRHSLKGKVGVIVRLYVDTLRALPRMLNKRKVVQATRRIHSRDFNEFITPKFYESNFLKMAIRDLFRFAR